MLVNLVKVRIKPEEREHFLKVIEHDAIASERDEAGCLRFNVVQDTNDREVYWFFEVYQDEAAMDAHRKTPHFGEWREAARTTLDADAERILCEVVFPADAGYWAKG